MALFLFLNELSFETPAPDFAAAQGRMTDFLALFREIASISKQLNPCLRIFDGMELRSLAAHYTVADWLNDIHVPRDEKSRFRILATKYPVVSPEEFPDAHDKGLTCSVLHQGQESLGLKAAYLCDQMAISLAPDESVGPMRSCALLELVDGENLEFKETVIEVRDIKRIQDVENYEDWFSDLLFQGLAGGFELWEKRQDYFPNLEFCVETEHQLRELDHGNAWLKPVFNSLFELNRVYKNWDWKGSIPDTIGKKLTPESARTLEEFPNEHTFERANGERILFSWHLRFTPGAGRLFFHSHHEDRVCVIGHLGDKLPNAT